MGEKKNVTFRNLSMNRTHHSLQVCESAKDAIPLPPFLKFPFISLFYFPNCLKNPSEEELSRCKLHEAKPNYSLLSALTALWLHLSLTYHSLSDFVLIYVSHICKSLPANSLLEELHLFHILYSSESSNL